MPSGFAVLLDAQMGQFEHLFDPDTGVAQNFDDRPGHEGAGDGVGDVDSLLRSILQGIDAHSIGLLARCVLDVGAPRTAKGSPTGAVLEMSCNSVACR